jgi:hypothetical protein
MHEDDFKALEARWYELYDSYESVKAQMPPVVRWEWTYRARYHPAPSYFLRQPPRGRVLKHLPSDDNRKFFVHEYGFDSQERVVIERQHRGETYYLYTPDTTEILTFAPVKNRYLLSFLAHFAMPGGRIEREANLKIDYSYIDVSMPYPAPGQIEQYTGKGVEEAEAAEIWSQLLAQQYALFWTLETYHYRGKRLEQIHRAWHLSQKPFNEMTDHFSYDRRNRLQRIVRTYLRGTPDALYSRRRRGETLASITANAKQKLVEAIPKMLAAAGLTDPLYCLNLFHSDKGNDFPPQFLPGFERDRQRKLQAYEPVNPDGTVHYHVESDLWWYLWDAGEDDDPPEHVPCEPLLITDAETLEACERLQAELYMHPSRETGVATMYEICRKLNRLNWSKFTPVTPDFIVYACDQTEHVEPAESLRLSGASEAQIVDWRSRRILDEEQEPW